jgi:hypothetical protein
VPSSCRLLGDFGNGTMPDMSPHHFDPAFNALGLDTPDTVIDPQAAIGSNMITYQYRARGDRGPLKLYWYDNGLKPPPPPGSIPMTRSSGEGNDGLMMCDSQCTLEITPGNFSSKAGAPLRPITVSAVARPSAVAPSRAMTWAVMLLVRPRPVRGSTTCE